MDRKITFAQYGCGKMAKYLIRYAIEKGASLVAAFDVNPAVCGKDAAEIVGDNYPETGIKISSASQADELLGTLKPDVCIIATRSTVIELEEIFTICAKHGINAITTCEEALYPWNSSPALTQKLDALAKQGNCTLTGVGYCDLVWGTMVTNLAGSSFQITKILGSSWYNVEDYGIAPCLSCVIVSATAGIRKPDAAIFEKAAEACGVPCGEMAYVGDTLSRDVLGCRNAGVALSVQISNPSIAHRDTAFTGTGLAPDVLIYDLEERPGIIRAFNLR